MNKIPLIVIMGPTGCGKTKLAIRLANVLSGEIVSADSMQIYKGMDIATAKPSLSQQAKIKHHLIDFVDSNQKFSVYDYTSMAHGIIMDIYKRGKVPLLVGGTGLYISSVIQNINFAESTHDQGIRDNLYNLLNEFGSKYLYKKLVSVDPISASNIHFNNAVKIIRALEIYYVTGKNMTYHNSKSKLNDSPYKVSIICISYMDRSKLYKKINDRVDKMIKSGLIGEAEQFYKTEYSQTSSQAIGYKELLNYFSGEKSLYECIENIKRSTRRYAKRQLTWFNKMDNVNWVYLDKKPKISHILKNGKKL